MLSKLIRLSLCTSFLFIQACSDGGSNTPPTLTISSEISVAENTTAVGTAVADDADLSDTLVLSISGGTDSALFSMDGSGAITFNSAPDYETPGDSDALNTYEMTVQVSDGTEVVTQDVVVTVTDVIENIAPTLTLDAAISVGENGTAVGTAIASDSDAEDTLTFSIAGGADAAMFSIGASTGVISFNAAPDYEATGSAAGTNDYEMTVQVSDGTEVVTQAVVVTVTDVAEPPAVGNVIDGPLQHAKVFADYNGNGIHDANEPHAMTDVDGGYSLSQNMPVPANYTMVVEMTADTIDAISGESYADSPVVLKAASGSAVVTPLTTILEVAKSADPTYTAEKLATAMGLPTGVDVSSYNPFAAGADQTTAHEVETVFQQVMTAQLVVAEAMKGLADVAGASDVTAKDASEAAMSAIAGMVVASAVTVDLADSTQVGELKEQAKTKVADLGITVDAAVADAMLTSASNAVATVSAALSNLTPDTFGTSAASSVSRLKHDAAGEVKAASVAVAAADLSAPGADLLAIVTSQLDSSLTLDEGANVDAAVTANVSEVDGYLGIRNLDFELPGGAGWKTEGDGQGGDTFQPSSFPSDGGNPGGYWSVNAADNVTYYYLAVSAGGFPQPLSDVGLQAGKIYKVSQDMKIFSTAADKTTVIGGMKVEFYKPNADATGFDKISDTGDIRVDIKDGGADWATYDFEYTIPTDTTHIMYVPLWGNDTHVGIDNIVISTDVILPTSIVVSDADGMVEVKADGSTGTTEIGGWNNSIGEWYGGAAGYIGFFQLPDMGQMEDPFATSELGVRVFEMSGAPDWDADLSLVRLSDDTNIIHETDYDADATLIQSSFLSADRVNSLGSLGGGAPRNLFTSADANVLLTAELNKAYDSGSGIGKYVVMRIAKPGDLPTSNGYKILTRNAGNPIEHPTIFFNGDGSALPGESIRTALASLPSKRAVTFQVDMSAVETNADGVYIAGGYFGQDGQLMTDNGNDVWSVTVELTEGATYAYKFRNQPSYGSWDGFEPEAGIVAGGCMTGQYNDRFVVVAEEDIILPVVAYGSCTSEPYVVSTDGGDTSTDTGTDGGDTSTDTGTDSGDTSTDTGTDSGDTSTDSGTDSGDSSTDTGGDNDVGTTTDIFFSEYSEGGGGSPNNTWHKYLEIYNPSSEIVELDNYFMGRVSNDNTYLEENPLYYETLIQFTAGATIAPGDVYVIGRDASAATNAPALFTEAGVIDQISSAISHSGDDGYKLFKKAAPTDELSRDYAVNTATIVDVFGSYDGAEYIADKYYDVCGVTDAGNNRVMVKKADRGASTEERGSFGTNENDCDWILTSWSADYDYASTLGSHTYSVRTIASASAISSYEIFDSTQTYTDTSTGTVEYKMTPVAGVDRGTTEAVANVVSFSGDPEVGILMINPDDAGQVWASEFVTITATGETTNTWGPHTGVQNFAFVLRLDSDDAVVLSSFAGSIIAPEGAVNTITASDLEGYWTYDTDSTFGASIALGPNAGSAEYFSVSDADEIGSRACQMDDIFQFGSGGGFTNHLGDQTYLEALNDTGAGFNQADTEGCGTPVAPHDGKHADPATWAWVDAAPNNQIQVSGVGAHIGLAKLHNGGELGLPNEATSSIYPITYDVVASTATTMTLQIMVNSNYWTFRLKKTVAPPDTTPPVITLTGDSAVTITVGSTYVDAGASADGGETVTVDSSTVDTSMAATYTVTYTASDAAGNEGTATRSVTVEAAASGPTSAITTLSDIVYDAASPNRVKEGVTVKGYVDAGGLRWVRPPNSGEAAASTYGTAGGSDDVNIGTVSFRKMRRNLAVSLPARFADDTTGQSYTHNTGWTATGDAHSYCASINGRLATAAEVKANLVPHLAAGTWDETFGWPRHRYDHYWTATGARAYAIELWPGWTQTSTVADAVAAGFEGFEGNKKVYGASNDQVTAGVLAEGAPMDYVRLATTNFGNNVETVVNDIDDVDASQNWANYYPLCVAPLVQ